MLAIALPLLLLTACGGSEQALEPEEQSALDRKLIAAAWENDLSEARRLIEEGADVNAKDDSVQSAYLISTSEGYVELLELTLEHGADVTSLDSFNGTGLIRAADRGHVEIVRRAARDRDRRRPRQQPRLDGAARGDHPRRRRPTPHRGRPAARRCGRRRQSRRRERRVAAHACAGPGVRRDGRDPESRRRPLTALAASPPSSLVGAALRFLRQRPEVMCKMSRRDDDSRLADAGTFIRRPDRRAHAARAAHPSG